MMRDLRSVRLPAEVSVALAIAARLAPLAAADLADLIDAARLRGYAIDGRPLERVRDWARLLMPLVVVTVRRASRVREAMEARGFAPDRPREPRAPPER